MSASVVVTGAAGPLGRRVVALAAADSAVGSVIAIDRPGVRGTEDLAALERQAGADVSVHLLDLTDPDLKACCEGAATVVHLGVHEGPAVDPGDPGDPVPAALDGTGVVGGPSAGTRHLFAVAADLGVRSLVVLSSAMVYGANPNNPVPLTEDAPLHPDPDLRVAIERAEAERLAGEWRDDLVDAGGPAPTVALLRPTVTVGPDDRDWLARSPWSTVGVRVHDADPPVQFLHIDDLAAAIDLARREHLDGPFNVAPDGWLPAEQVRALSGPAPRVHLPAPLAERLASARAAAGLGGRHPAVLPYTMHAWVVANDRLRAAGWQPAHTNEEAYVEGDPGGPLTSLNPKRRQLLSMGVVVGAVAGLVLGAVVLVRRRTRRR